MTHIYYCTARLDSIQLPAGGYAYIVAIVAMSRAQLVNRVTSFQRQAGFEFWQSELARLQAEAAQDDNLISNRNPNLWRMPSSVQTVIGRKQNQGKAAIAAMAQQPTELAEALSQWRSDWNTNQAALQQQANTAPQPVELWARKLHGSATELTKQIRNLVLPPHFDYLATVVLSDQPLPELEVQCQFS
ncbi:hypothetical protein [Ferrimonas senticii]|uniref:hypothetical protein n=1 Tax=Ferrimonas senticii TaxID=394566 RepID=UPI0004256368|nr:hypothetical protein [Ferrimonas senticii]